MKSREATQQLILCYSLSVIIVQLALFFLSLIDKTFLLYEINHQQRLVTGFIFRASVMPYCLVFFGFCFYPICARVFVDFCCQVFFLSPLKALTTRCLKKRTSSTIMCKDNWTTAITNTQLHTSNTSPLLLHLLEYVLLLYHNFSIHHTTYHKHHQLVPTTVTKRKHCVTFCI